jgi:hypothetical protein
VLRRQFGLVAAAVALGTGCVSDHSRPDEDSALNRELRRLFSRPADAAEVGRRYLAAYPAKANRGALLADLLQTHSACAANNPCPSDHLFSQWQQRDFRDSVVVQLDGWILARTEASLCALVHLGQWA